MGAEDVRGSCLFDMVVRINRLLCAGMRSCSRSWSSEILVAAGNGSERVDGRLRPGKDVRRTFTVGEAMVPCNKTS
jgi:hypothetical protein